MLILQVYLLTPAGEQAAEAHNGTPLKKRALAKKFLGSAPVPLGVKLLNWPAISGPTAGKAFRAWCVGLCGIDLLQPAQDRRNLSVTLAIPRSAIDNWPSMLPHGIRAGRMESQLLS